ncbi:unnamed protein product [Periconia digitata]|uniref:Uncharacterized protein n=1 Tax=Periconia digitata TaxID=1303443 RepID=A0A9W4UPV9_9PLEO|nr:unnamed protein product [Periconia digitata]
MASPPAKTHILDRNNYTSHHLVTLSPAPTLPPLPPSSLRLRTKIISLSTNNLSYARMGHLLGWWDTYPLPLEQTPAPFNDASKYGRISAWGYAEVVESNVAGIEAGSATLYGYLPISSEVWTVAVEQTGIKGQIVVVDAYRQHLLKMYNRYTVLGASVAELEERGDGGLDSLGWDALMLPTFGTAYNMNMYGFAWEDGNRVHPGGEREWTAADADLDDAVVVVLNASGKTAMSWAYALRNYRPKEHQPKMIVGVASEASKAVVEGSGFYDKVVLNPDAEAFVADPALSQARRVLLFDFGAREGALKSWRSALSSAGIPFTFMGLGGEVKALSQEEVMKALSSQPSDRIQVHADVMREKGIAVKGQQYFDEFNHTWERFKATGGIRGINLVWGQSLEDWEQGWEALCHDKIPNMAGTGLLYRI